MKRLISLVLVLSLLLLAVPALAISHTYAQEVSLSDNVIFYDKAANLKLLYSEDRFGNPIIKQYVDEILVGEAKTVLNESKVISTSYTNMAATKSNTSTQTIYYTPVNKQVNAPKAYTSLGRIRYQYADGGGGICGANVSLETTTHTGSRYNVRGTYQNLAALVGYIIGVFSLPNAIASQVAAAVLSWAGFAVGTISFFIPDKYLRCTEEINKFKLVNMSNSGHIKYITGTKFTITEESPQQNRVYYDGTYHPSNVYSSQNTVFAHSVFLSLFAYTSWNIYAWN